MRFADHIYVDFGRNVFLSICTTYIGRILMSLRARAAGEPLGDGFLFVWDGNLSDESPLWRIAPKLNASLAMATSGSCGEMP